MKLTTVILIVSLIQVSAAGRAQQITFNKDKISLPEFFSVIKKQTGFNVVWDPQQLNQAGRISGKFNNVKLTEALDFSLQGTGLGYTIADNTVVIRKKHLSLLDRVFGIFALSDIRGRVLNDRGTPLFGATVKVKGSNRSVTTNEKGEFTINGLEETTILEISFIGYRSLEVSVRGASFRKDIVLEEDISKLDEVAIEAYRENSQRLSTSNISRVSADELAKQPVLNPLQALQGRIPGMVVTQNTGVPGARINVQVRGRANFDKILTSDQPLFILDGVPLAAGNDRVNAAAGPFGVAIGDGMGAIAGLNTADIESISVLKDADATAIYGSRGANGVILITTKKGKAGALSINANLFTGASVVSKIPEMLNTTEYLAMRNEAFSNDKAAKTNTNAYDLLLWNNQRYTDFGKLLIGNTAKTYDAQVSASGGSKTTQFRVGAGYHKEGTVYPGDQSADRSSLNFSTRTQSENGKFTMDLSGLYSVTQSDLPAVDLASAILLPPNFRIYDGKGQLAWNEGGFNDLRDNPLSQFKQQYKSSMANLNANMILNYKLFDHVTLRSSFGYNSTINNDRRIIPIAGQNPAVAGLNGQSAFGNGTYKNWIIEPQIEYGRVFGKGKLDVLAGGTFNRRNNTTLVTTGRNYTNDDLLGTLAGAGLVNAINTDLQYNYQAFFGRINYNWDDKYIVNLTGRRDGSSKFGPNQRFSNFGAVGAAWIFSSESFLKGNKLLSYGKLRGSYGKTGNDQIQDYFYYDAWSPGSNYTDSTTLVPTRLFNGDLHWEANEKAEIAVELGFLKDRILLTTALYRNISSDPLVQYPLPSLTGFRSITSNLNGVKVENRGIEITLSTKNFQRGRFQWSTDFNITVPQNRLKAYPNLEGSTYSTTYTIGKSLTQFYGTQYTGVDPKTGLYTVLDVDGNGSAGTADYKPLQNTDPKFYGGLSNNFSYMGFSLSFFLQFTKQMGYHWRGNNNFNPPGTIYNVPVAALDRWQAEGQQTDVQKFTTSAGSFLSTSGFFAMMTSNARLTDASYLRLKNVSISYELPAKWTKAVGIRSAKVYTQGQNLLTITGYKVSDPEIQNYTIMAPLRTITGGVQFTF